MKKNSIQYPSKYFLIIVFAVSFFMSCKKNSAEELAASPFGFLVNGDNITISDFKGDNTLNIILPTIYKGLPVTTIASNLFNYNVLIKKKLIVTTKTEIVDDVEVAKKDTVNKYILVSFLMEKIEIPSSITYIGNEAFAMPSLKEVTMQSATPPNLGTSVFTTKQKLIIIVPFANLEMYKSEWTMEKIGVADVEWKTF